MASNNLTCVGKHEVFFLAFKLRELPIQLILEYSVS